MCRSVSIMKAVGVLNVHYQPFSSGAFGASLKERWASWLDHMLATGQLEAVARDIAFDRQVKFGDISDVEAWVRETVLEYQADSPVYVKHLA